MPEGGWVYECRSTVVRLPHFARIFQSVAHFTVAVIIGSRIFRCRFYPLPYLPLPIFPAAVSSVAVITVAVLSVAVFTVAVITCYHYSYTCTWSFLNQTQTFTFATSPAHADL